MAKGASINVMGLGIAAAAAAVLTFSTPLLRGATATLPPQARLAIEGAWAFLWIAGAGAALVGIGARQLRSALARLAPDEVEEVVPVIRAGFTSRWLIEPVAELVSRWAVERGKLSSVVQEIKIRHKVSEAERQHVEAILHSLRDAVLVTDGFDELSMANGTAARLLGFDLRNAEHAPIDRVLSDETVRRLIREVRSAGVQGKERRIEHSISDENGLVHAYDVTVASLPDNDSESGGVVTIMRDVTRDKEISQMKSDFVSQASHELRTPLASIRAYVEMLTEGEAKDEESRQEFYGIIRTETDRVARMVDNMLNISRIEAGIVKAELTDVDFAGVSRQVVEMMQPQAQEKSIKLAIKHGPLVYNAQADRDMMFQVVMNLVSNGIKYTPDGGRVTVTVDNDDATRSVLVTIADTGLGIPPDALEKVFDKFFRIENYKRVAKGTGLGLNLVRHIVETVHHGRVGVSSEVGMGSKFWFAIPYEQDQLNQ